LRPAAVAGPLENSAATFRAGGVDVFWADGVQLTVDLCTIHRPLKGAAERSLSENRSITTNELVKA
jgi:hypothetical protein